MSMSSRYTAAAERMRMPLMPVRVPTDPLEPAPFMLRLRRRTVLSGSFAFPTGMLMITPVVPLARIEAKTSWQSMVIDLVMVTAPNPPGSRQLDLAIDRRLADGAGKRLARGGTGTRVDVITDTGHPGPGRLRLRQ